MSYLAVERGKDGRGWSNNYFRAGFEVLCVYEQIFLLKGNRAFLFGQEEALRRQEAYKKKKVKSETQLAFPKPLPQPFFPSTCHDSSMSSSLFISSLRRNS